MKRKKERKRKEEDKRRKRKSEREGIERKPCEMVSNRSKKEGRTGRRKEGRKEGEEVERVKFTFPRFSTTPATQTTLSSSFSSSSSPVSLAGCQMTVETICNSLLFIFHFSFSLFFTKDATSQCGSGLMCLPLQKSARESQRWQTAPEAGG